MKKFAISALLIALTGCASTYKIPDNQASASVSFDLTSDSKSTTSKSFIVSAYEDLSCAPSKYGTRLGTKWPANDHEVLGPVAVAAEVPLTFAVYSSESRFAQNRGCSFTASFTPRAGQHYSVRFASVDQSLACSAKIEDGSGAQVPYQVPEISCAATSAGKVKNGGGSVLDWKVHVETAR